jgi:hypothetical protein
MFVIVGGATRSCSARAPNVSGPCCSMEASADSWLGVRPDADSWRRRRARRVALKRSRAATSVVSSVASFVSLVMPVRATSTTLPD